MLKSERLKKTLGNIIENSKQNERMAKMLLELLETPDPARNLTPRAADVFKRGENCLDNCNKFHSINCPHAPRRV